MTDLRDAVRDVRNALVEPAKLVQALAIGDKAQRQGGGGVLICCPVHGERNPSCSVTRGPDGTVRVRCFACDFSADAIGLVAQVLGLPTRGDGFRETLAEAAELGGLLALASELRGGEPAPRRERPAAPAPELPAPYPDSEEVTALWEQAVPAGEDALSSGYLVARRIDPDEVDRRKLARALRDAQPLPEWARFHGQSWLETGHRLVLRVFDANGELRSVRACRVIDGESPKRLPPARKRAAELVLANRAAVGMLLGRIRPRRVLLVEGEPDFLTWATRTDEPVIGIGSGWWSSAFAARIPTGAEVVIRTHADAQGERYAASVAESIGERCQVWRAA